MAKAKKSTASVEDADDLLVSIKKELNSGKGGQVAFFLDSDESTPTDLSNWVSTGSEMLDLAISNRKHGGLPFGRIIELMGNEGSGKSLLCMHVAAEVQKLGGFVFYIDTETATNHEFGKAVGVDFANKKFMYIHESLLENCFAQMDKIIDRVAAHAPDTPVLIVLDSVSQSTTESVDEADYSKKGWNTTKAIVMGQALRKITQKIARHKILFIATSQLRINLAITFGDNTTTAGGKALGFAASLRLKLTKSQTLKSADGDIIGVQTKAKIVKNRFGPPNREIQFDIFFDRGIDDTSTWMELFEKHEMTSQSGHSFIIAETDTRPEIKFKKSTFKSVVLDNPQLRKSLYEELADKYIMHYQQSTDSSKATEEDSIVRIDAPDEEQ
jgi:recombination protein RecA